MTTQSSLPNYFNCTESNPCVISLSSGRGCWQCEQRLPAVPLCVVSTVDLSNADFVYLVCADCAEQVCDELVRAGIESEILNADATSSLLRGADIQAVIEGWQDSDIGWYRVLTGTVAVRRARSLIVVIQ